MSQVEHLHRRCFAIAKLYCENLLEIGGESVENLELGIEVIGSHEGEGDVDFGKHYPFGTALTSNLGVREVL